MENRMETLDMNAVLNDAATFEPDALRACKTLARTKPWQGTFEKRLGDVQTCVAALVEVYGLKHICIRHVGNQGGCSGASDISPDGLIMSLRGRLSVVTALHLFAKARRAQAGKALDGAGHVAAIKWSVNLFRRVFPISFGRCRLVGGLLVNDSRRDD